jgi:8-oxo-dGTP diphosphatase
MPSDKSVQTHFALAVLLVHGRYVMQLRDNKPGIAAPGVWALFGGRVEYGEEPKAALIREVQEELGLNLPDCSFLGSLERDDPSALMAARYWVFEADITASWDLHQLMEGQAAAHFTFEELRELKTPAVIREVLEGHYAEKSFAPQPPAAFGQGSHQI